MFRISARREDTFIAGFSMGGYGALRCALTYPEHYAAAASFCGALDIAWLRDNLLEGQNYDEVRGIFGLELNVEPECDLMRLAERVAVLPAHEQPKILMTCGRGDYLWECNIKVRNHFSALPLSSFRWEDWDGEHNWGFCDQSIFMAINHFFEV
jgi:S-formylglutathione hydrolase FrmB